MTCKPYFDKDLLPHPSSEVNDFRAASELFGHTTASVAQTIGRSTALVISPATGPNPPAPFSIREGGAGPAFLLAYSPSRVGKGLGLGLLPAGSVTKARSTRATRTRLVGLIARGLVRELGKGPKDPQRQYFLAQKE